MKKSEYKWRCLNCGHTNNENKENPRCVECHDIYDGAFNMVSKKEYLRIIGVLK